LRNLERYQDIDFIEKNDKIWRDRKAYVNSEPENTHQPTEH